MWRTPVSWWTVTVALIVAGCASGPLQDNPLLIRPERPAPQDNPIYIMAGPRSYGLVFEKILDVGPVVWMLVRKQHFRGRHHRPGFVAVHPGHLVGPFPAAAHKPESETTHIHVARASACR